ncbi:hypothetical protein SBF1_3330006 [Candidatus Desulfosporosinus infrequens]|uniref:Uncharacterized protein n=1 Tax=Candidatus Desulfosporosinus infrequens TaxID=2043169 RepID=A0A2U3L0U3_9FIRM|nr:hypothetical protein SBF1_3330006 [Candidatus Desulfosporosinus infrequens]
MMKRTLFTACDFQLYLSRKPLREFMYFYKELGGYSLSSTSGEVINRSAT